MDPYQPYRGRLLSADEVRRLSALRPARAAADAALCWAAILAAWAAAAWLRTPWVVAAAIPVIGARYYALFILGHDGMHRRLLEPADANDRFCDLLLLGPVGAITRLNNKNHLEHHLHLAGPRDPDRHKHASFNKADRAALFGYLTGLSSAGRSLGNVFLRTPGRAGAGAGYATRDAAILLGWQAALLGGLTWAVGWWAYPVLWLLPVYAFAFLGDNLRSWAEHSHPEPDAAADRHRLVSYDCGALERFFIAPMGMNFHAAHHLWPSIPYYNLREADSLMRSRAGAAGLEWRPSYLGYLRRYLRRLPLEERRPRAAAAR